MKPHAGIYAEAERRFALEARRATVFVDDRVDKHRQRARRARLARVSCTAATTARSPPLRDPRGRLLQDLIRETRSISANLCCSWPSNVFMNLRLVRTPEEFCRPAVVPGGTG